MRPGVVLLPRSALVRTGPVDHADWNYRPVLGWVSNQRVRMIARLLRKGPRGADLLEIGYGSGVYMPTWAQFADRLHGLDIHEHTAAVSKALADFGIAADLKTGTAEAMPYPAAGFDVVIGVSVLEFVPDLAAACREVARVLRPDGRFLVVTPGQSWAVDLGLRVMTGESAAKDFGDRRQRILGTLAEHFDVVQRLSFPSFTGQVLRLYTALSLVRRPAS